jgi:hypothetical protein
VVASPSTRRTSPRPGFASVFGLSGAGLANALNQLDGEVATGAQRAAFEIVSEFLSMLFDPSSTGAAMHSRGPTAACSASRPTTTGVPNPASAAPSV